MAAGPYPRRERPPQRVPVKAHSGATRRVSRSLAATLSAINQAGLTDA
ncbi:MAG: hypothetical protein KatS3mg123_2076 [Burkholderiales bacterium]|nr:MAG: hypothetical protein KatS3mg123_2076 [Burkholderiales bacterium]